MTREYVTDTLALAKLRKVKSAMLVEALVEGSSTRGNHKVEYGYLDNIQVFEFYYRCTKIVKVHILADGTVLTEDVYAGEYDNTPATMRQRQDIKVAVAEIEIALTAVLSVS